MKDIFKLASLLAVFVISMTPLVYFLFTENGAMNWIILLFRGGAHIQINVLRNVLMIVSHIFMGIWEISLPYSIVLISSAVLLIISLGLIARLLYQMTLHKQRNR